MGAEAVAFTPNPPNSSPLTPALTPNPQPALRPQPSPRTPTPALLTRNPETLTSLVGDCCPTKEGLLLGCCSEDFAPPASPPAPPAPPPDRKAAAAADGASDAASRGDHKKVRVRVRVRLG